MLLERPIKTTTGFLVLLYVRNMPSHVKVVLARRGLSLFQVDTYASAQNLGHEIGHIFGCDHYSKRNPAYSYGKGWRIKKTTYRTIMAYVTRHN